MTEMSKMPDYLQPARKNKYSAKKQYHPDYGTFDSLAEYHHYEFLKIQQQDGFISNLERQVRYDIIINGVKVCWVKPDYRYEKDGKIVVSDYKGMLLPEAKLKFKLLKAVYGIDVLIIKKPGEKY